MGEVPLYNVCEEKEGPEPDASERKEEVSVHLNRGERSDALPREILRRSVVGPGGHVVQRPHAPEPAITRLFALVNFDP